MGHLVNAKGFRLGVSKFWNVKGFSKFGDKYFKLNSAYNFLSYYVENLLSAKKYKDNAIFFGQVDVVKKNVGYSLNIYVFGGFLDVIYFNFLKSRSLQKVLTQSARITRIKFLRKFVILCQVYLFGIIKQRIFFDLEKYGVISVNFLTYSELNLTAGVIGRIIAYKLESLYTINQIVNPIVKDYLLIKKMGLAINCSGRFTRKQRAHFLKFRNASVPFSTVLKPIDYFFIAVKLKYGVCGIKIWTA
jgi:hypothetical protein